jgi:hypothetical protein
LALISSATLSACASSRASHRTAAQRRSAEIANVVVDCCKGGGHGSISSVDEAEKN